MRRKLLSILALLLTAVSGAWAGTQATGYFESCTAHHGSIRVKGWAYDPDQPATSIQVHAYIWYGSSVGTTKEERMPAVGINANIERSDVNEAKGITGAHGFDQYIAVPAGTYTVQVYASDKTGDGNPKIPGTSGNPATYTVTVTDPYNITYDANGGSGAPDAQKKGEFVQINLSAAKPTRDGYVFKEWNTAQDGSSISYAPGAAYTADGDATLYAQWLKLVASGDCGTGVTYSLAEDGKLTISGSGAMTNFNLFMTKAPWDGNKASITSVVIESGVTSIGNNAFNECSNLASVTIPTGVTSIGQSAFSGCSTLETITLPAGVMTLGNSVFQNCSKLSSVTLPDLMTSIGSSAFSGCIALETITLPAGLTTINNQTFFNCFSLASITLPASLTTIGTSVFSGCTALANFNVDANSNSFATEDGVLFNKDKTKLVRYPQGKSGNTYTIPTSVTTIDKYAFYSCSSLTEITLPDALTTIDKYAFYYCSKLEAITIPASVTGIDYYAFADCSNLATVTLNSNPYINANAFNNIAADATVTMNLTANSAGGAYWMTFYNQNYKFQADENTQIFKAALEGAGLTLTELTTDKIVNANNAVILKSTAGTITMTLVTSKSSNDFNSNSLKGVATAAGLTAADPSTTFVLNNGTQGVGFYRLAKGKTLGVGKAYLTYSGSLAPEFLGFGNETTGIDATLVNSEKVNSVVYDLQGRKVAQPTKGLYIVNGKKVVIK